MVALLMYVVLWPHKLNFLLEWQAVVLNNSQFSERFRAGFSTAN